VGESKGFKAGLMGEHHPVFVARCGPTSLHKQFEKERREMHAFSERKFVTPATQ
jgi:hypothetical protein